MPRNYIKTTDRQVKPVLPPPTFKYGSNTYICLVYAKMTGKNFSIQDIRKFTNRYTNDHDVKRSLQVLEKNGSIERTANGYWKVTPKGVTHVYDFAKRRAATSSPSD